MPVRQWCRNRGGFSSYLGCRLAEASKGRHRRALKPRQASNTHLGVNQCPWRHQTGLLLMNFRTLGIALLSLLLSGGAPGLTASALELGIKRADAGYANGEVLVQPDCAGSSLKIKPCGRVARSWLNHLNSRSGSFVAAYRAAGYDDEVTSAVLGCGAGIYSPRKSRQGVRNSRHAYAEACDGSWIWVNGVKFSYRRAVRDAASIDRRFFVTFLDSWGEVGPGCVPEKGFQMFGLTTDCRPVVADNCGVIDWRERGANSQYGSTYHLSFCYYTDTNRAYE